MALAVASPAALGATIDVTTTQDEFAEGTRCSLREAIQSANDDATLFAAGCRTGSGADVIRLPAGRFDLTQNGTPMDPNVSSDLSNRYGDLDVTSQITIVHKGIRPAIIDGPFFDRAIHNGGTLTLLNVTITGGRAFEPGSNNGGGILNAGTLSVRNSLIEGNSAVFGGGLSTSGDSTATLRNVTFSGNRAQTDGGGLSVETGGTVTLLSSTVAANTADTNNNGGGDGGGAAASTSAAGGVLRLHSTLLAGNIDNGGEAHDCVELGGSIVSLGRTLVGNTEGCTYDPGPRDIRNRSALLLPLTDNGGPTLTHALRKQSPAINRGGGCRPTDQRGVMRALGHPCDIGAWELVRCRGVVVNRIGTSGGERITGTARADGILALGGPDVVAALGGNDGLCGGGGGDRLEGGAGQDDFDGGPGFDTCLGGGGPRSTFVRCERPRAAARP